MLVYELGMKTPTFLIFAPDFLSRKSTSDSLLPRLSCHPKTVTSTKPCPLVWARVVPPLRAPLPDAPRGLGIVVSIRDKFGWFLPLVGRFDRAGASMSRSPSLSTLTPLGPERLEIPPREGPPLRILGKPRGPVGGVELSM